MQQTFVTALLLALSVVASVVLYKGIRSARQKGEWDFSATYFLLVPTIYFLPMGVGQLTGAVSLYFDIFFNHVTILQPWLLEAQRATVLLLAALGFGTFWLFGVLRRASINPIAFALIAVVLTGGVSNAVNDVGPIIDDRAIALIGLILGASVLPRGRGVQLGVGTFGVLLAVASSLMTVLNATQAFRECRIDKCGFLGTLLLGATTGENILGLTIMTALPFAWLGFRGKTRVLLTVYLSFMILATGSRTALFGAAFVIALLVITKVSMDEPTARFRRFALTSLVVATAIAVVFPLQDADADEFSLRGILWTTAKEKIGESPILGQGPGGWLNLYETGQLTGTPSAGAHNFFLLILHEGGVIALLFCVIALVGMIRAGGHLYTVAAVLVLIPVIAAGTLEQPWEMTDLAWSSWGMIAAMCAVPKKSDAYDLAAPKIAATKNESVLR